MKDPSMIALLVKPFVIGAKLQIKRYEQARVLCEEDAILGTNLCMHEVSALFEDLATIAYYLKVIDLSHPNHDLWIDVRHHLRHDLREELDKDEAKKSGRAKRLKINQNLQMDLGFKEDSIKVGDTVIKLTEVTSYLDWASREVGKIFKKGVEQGRIKPS